MMRRDRRKRTLATLALVVAAALAAVGSAAAAPPASEPLSSTGRWLTDENGRVVILHGVNIPKSWVRDATQGDFGLGRDDVEFLVENGFNTVRLGYFWESVEPQPGVINDAYLDEMVEVQRQLTDAGIHVMLDMHQDMYGRKYGTERTGQPDAHGAPEWAVIDEGLPAQPNVGFPGNYIAMPAQNRAWDNFWANRPAPDGVGLQDHYAAMWRAVAERFAGDPYVVGWDLMNEPWAGTPWPLSACADPISCGPLLDRMLLAPFHQRVANAIREVDDTHIVWYEPFLPFAFTASTAHPGLDDPNQGFSFHNYCLAGSGALGTSSDSSAEACHNREERVFQKAEVERNPEAALVVSEFGASNHYPEIERVADLADKYMVSWQHWMYCAMCITGIPASDDETAADGSAIVFDMRRPPEGDNVDDKKLDVLVRPYPHAVAGTPLSYGFDRDTGVFTLRYSTERPDGSGRFGVGSVTRVFVPERHYPGGYTTSVEGATAHRAGAQGLELITRKGATEVTLTITPKGPRS